MSEDRGDGGGDRNTLFAGGKPTGGQRLLLGEPANLVPNPGPELIAARGADRDRQEDAVRIAWTGRRQAAAALAGPTRDLSREANGDVAVILDLKVDGAPSAPATLNGRDVTARLRQLAGTKAWGPVAVPLRCAVGVDLKTQPVTLATAGTLDLTISRVRLGTATEGLVDCR